MSLSNFTLLYVEDSHDAQDYMKHYIEDEVKEFYQAFDGEEGLRTYHEKKPDIVLTDINMPKMNGLEMCVKIKSVNSHQSVILLSAFQDIETLKIAINAGVDGFILKPLDANNILLDKLNFIAENLQNRVDAASYRSRMELALLSNNDGIWDWNLQDNSVYFSPRWKEMLGYKDDELPNEFSSWESRVHQDDLQNAISDMSKNISGQTDYFENVHRLKHKNETWVWILDRGKTIYDEEKKPVRMIGTHTDITQERDLQLKYSQQVELLTELQSKLEKQKDALEHKAHNDGLTGIANRVFFNATLSEAIQDAKNSNKKVALFFIDLDDFKEINDTLGHHVGDETLKIIAKRLTKVVRNVDTVARLGGDEFSVIIKNLESIKDVQSLANKIITTVSSPMKIEDNTVSVSCSLGISVYPDNAQDDEALLKYSDEAMYRAKKSGKNTYQ